MGRYKLTTCYEVVDIQLFSGIFPEPPLSQPVILPYLGVTE